MPLLKNSVSSPLTSVGSSIAAYLAPAIKRAIFQGTQPGRLQIQNLIARRSADWSVQWRDLLDFVSERNAAAGLGLKERGEVLLAFHRRDVPWTPNTRF